MMQAATLDTESEIFARGFTQIAGVDEVGRGALAGPVAVGVAVITAQHTLEIEGLIDSKALTEKVRHAMVPLIQQWATTAVGSVTPAEIDVLGMTASLRLAANRAMVQVVAAGARPGFVLLDGKHDWLTDPAPDLFAGLSEADQLYEALKNEAWGSHDWQGIPVQTIIKGDYTCASIAAASVVAKVERDATMVELAQEHPVYGWEGNKGYGSAKHRSIIAEQGASVHHRLSWNLGLSPEQLHQAHLLRMMEGIQ